MNNGLSKVDSIIYTQGYESPKGSECPYKKLTNIRGYCLWMAGSNDKERGY